MAGQGEELARQGVAWKGTAWLGVERHGMAGQGKARQKVKCEYCRTYFAKNSKHHRFCSERCKHRAQRDASLAARPDWSTMGKTVECECGREFVAKSDLHRHCSKRCRDRAAKLKSSAIRGVPWSGSVGLGSQKGDLPPADCSEMVRVEPSSGNGYRFKVVDPHT